MSKDVAVQDGKSDFELSWFLKKYSQNFILHCKYNHQFAKDNESQLSKVTALSVKSITMISSELKDDQGKEMIFLFAKIGKNRNGELCLVSSEGMEFNEICLKKFGFSIKLLN